MDFIEQSLEKLRENKKRITETRRDILEIFQDFNIPMSANTIWQEIQRRHKSADLVTVYRVLEAFSKLEIIHETGQGFVKCSEQACTNHKHCHHHFFCQSCEKVEEVHIDDQNFIASIEEKFPNLNINGHKFEFSGTCSDCK